MNVVSHIRSLEGRVVSENVLLTGLSGLCRDLLLDSVSVGALCCHEALCVSRERSDSRICDFVGKSLEVRSCADEVSLATETYDGTLALCEPYEDSTFGGLTVSPLRSHELTLLTDDVHCLLEIAVSLCKSLLAVHHAGTGHLA